MQWAASYTKNPSQSRCVWCHAHSTFIRPGPVIQQHAFTSRCEASLPVGRHPAIQYVRHYFNLKFLEATLEVRNVRSCSANATTRKQLVGLGIPAHWKNSSITTSDLPSPPRQRKRRKNHEDEDEFGRATSTMGLLVGLDCSFLRMRIFDRGSCCSPSPSITLSRVQPARTDVFASRSSKGPPGARSQLASHTRRIVIAVGVS